MRYVADHDYHIHSTISPCCHDENQTPDAILRYGEENGLSSVCLTNHLWDERVKSEAEWHDGQRFCCLEAVLPLPQSEKTRMLFGAEIDMDYDYILGVSPERYDVFDFMVISTTHLHLAGNTVRQKIQIPEEAAGHWVTRFRELLKKDLPWHKTGIAHLTCGHIMKGRTAEVLPFIDDKTLYELFSDSAKKGLGIELNTKTLFSSEEEKNIMLRPYYIAKDCGCKFYLGSDSHKNEALKGAKDNFERIITLLDLQEEHKFKL